MLILIQFDVCGYDLMHALQMAGEPGFEISATDQTVDDENEIISQWDDPVYRGVNSRNIFRASVVECPIFHFILQIGEQLSKQWTVSQSQAVLSDTYYLRYCVLLI